MIDLLHSDLPSPSYIHHHRHLCSNRRGVRLRSLRCKPDLDSDKNDRSDRNVAQMLIAQIEI